jgi:hypothetical protein
MSDKLDQNEAEAEAARVLKVHGQSRPPIDPFAIANDAHIHVCIMETQEPGVAGCLLRVGNEFGIQYSCSLPNEGFIRFTVAHELGHYFIPGHAEHLFTKGDGIHKSRGDFSSGDRLERQADFFASSLLMPMDQFSKAIWQADAGLDGVIHLADVFGTSLTATAINYARHAEIPLAIIMSNDQSIEYCILSESLKSIPNLGWPKKGDPLSRTTATYRLNERVAAGERCDRLDGECGLDDWFEDAPEVEMTEESLHLGGYGKTLTAIYTEEDLDQLFAEADD